MNYLKIIINKSIEYKIWKQLNEWIKKHNNYVNLIYCYLISLFVCK